MKTFRMLFLLGSVISATILFAACEESDSDTGDDEDSTTETDGTDTGDDADSGDDATDDEGTLADAAAIESALLAYAIPSATTTLDIDTVVSDESAFKGKYLLNHAQAVFVFAAVTIGSIVLTAFHKIVLEGAYSILLSGQAEDVAITVPDEGGVALSFTYDLEYEDTLYPVDFEFQLALNDSNQTTLTLNVYSPEIATAFPGLAALGNENGWDGLIGICDSGVFDSSGNVIGAGVGSWTLKHPETDGDYMDVTYTIADADNRNLRFEITDSTSSAFGTFTNYKVFEAGDDACAQINFFNAEDCKEYTILSDTTTEEGLYIKPDDETTCLDFDLADETLCWDFDLANADCSALTTTCEVQEL